MSILMARWRWLALLLPLMLAVAAPPVWAAEPISLELQAPEQADLGGEVSVTAVVRDGAGAPVRGATVVLWSSSSFLSVGGAIELGQATTDAQGKASFMYEARAQGPVTLNAYFPGDGRYPGAQGSAEISVQGTAQLYQSTAGVRVPGVGVWLLAGILGGVWSTYFTVMVFLALIAREGSKFSVDAGGGHA